MPLCTFWMGNRPSCNKCGLDIRSISCCQPKLTNKLGESKMNHIPSYMTGDCCSGYPECIHRPMIVPCVHAYSRSMNQDYPRSCIKCGQKETPSDEYLIEKIASCIVSAMNVAEYNCHSANVKHSDRHNRYIEHAKQEAKYLLNLIRRGE